MHSCWASCAVIATVEVVALHILVTKPIEVFALIYVMASIFASSDITYWTISAIHNFSAKKVCLCAFGQCITSTVGRKLAT